MVKSNTGDFFFSLSKTSESYTESLKPKLETKLVYFGIAWDKRVNVRTLQFSEIFLGKYLITLIH